MGELFPTIVYILCFLTSTACAWLLGRSYAKSRVRLLLWIDPLVVQCGRSVPSCSSESPMMIVGLQL